jgi:feruloyl esterase
VQGNGGFGGSIQTWWGDWALARGYATAGTDTGHQGHERDGSPFLDNWERIVNWGYRAIHLTTVDTKIITRIFYDEDIRFSYFNGCSLGGRQGMMESQRYPKDFDGIIVGAPAYKWGGKWGGGAPTQNAMFPIGRALDDPVFPVSKVPLIDEAVVANCDHEDGVVDGLIGDPRNCSFDHWDLQCTGETGEAPSTCLTEDELGVLDLIYHPFMNDQGEEWWPYPFGLVGWARSMVFDPEVLDLFGFPNGSYGWGQEGSRYFICSDPDYDFQNDPPCDGHEQRMLDLREVFDAVNTDLSEFRDNGGKMIMWQGWSDPAFSALGTIKYYEDAEANKANAKGRKEDIRDFARLFMLPGVAHCGGGPGPGANWGGNFVSVLERWVEEGIAPERVIRRGGEVPDRRRPLCPYPQVAVWDGVNDPDDAASFTCQLPD